MKELLCNTRLSNVHIFCKRALLKYLVTEKGGKKAFHSVREKGGKKKPHKSCKKETECIFILSNQVLSHIENTKHWKFKWAYTKGLTMGHTFSAIQKALPYQRSTVRSRISAYLKKKNPEK